MSTLHPAAPAVSHAADRPRYLWAGATTFDVVLGPEHTAGSLGLLDQDGRYGDATPRHLHHDEAEIFYVLEGSLRAWAGEDVHDVGPGDALWLPPDLAHAFAVTSETARIVTVTTPAGFVDFVRAAGVPTARAVPATWEFDLGRLMAAAEPHRIEVVGPPPLL